MQESRAPADNPLLGTDPLPAFADIRPEHVEPAIRQVLEIGRAALTELETVDSPSKDWLKSLERIHDSLQRVWGPVSHLNSVASTSELRAAFNACLPLITDFETDLGQNGAIYRRFVALAEGGQQQGVEARLVEQSIRDFKLAGVALEGAPKQRFRELMQSLAAKHAAFEQNLMDASDAFSHHETDLDKLAGLPGVVLGRARQAAEERGLQGWWLVLDPPTYQAVMSHAEHEALRELYYRAWTTRASEHGEGGEQWNNGPLIDEILALRHETARLLGFENYAELSLATKMAATPGEVIDFLQDLGQRSRAGARAELDELSQFAGRPLAAWDVAFYAERLKQDRFSLSEEELRPYFALPRVLSGLFELAGKLFGIRIAAELTLSPWHPSVQYYSVSNLDGAAVGGFYTDLFARANKRGGAWMDVCRNRSGIENPKQTPVAHLVCNFNPAVGDAPSLLTHSDVVTLFHEFGHSLHHLLTEVDYPSLAGINGVAWDAVELPSQFLENYAWRPEVLSRISAHFETGEALPADKIETLNASRSFLAGLAMVRQLEFALFDFELHGASQPFAGQAVYELLAKVRGEVAVIEHPPYNRFANSFAHVFAGGYAAGYYSYKWAEVLAADAFAAFEERGIFDAETAERFRRSILAVGGSRDALAAFVDFRGRPPQLDPLLRQSGLESAR
jgi:oligopeptidase A